MEFGFLKRTKKAGNTPGATKSIPFRFLHHWMFYSIHWFGTDAFEALDAISWRERERDFIEGWRFGDWLESYDGLVHRVEQMRGLRSICYYSII